MKELLIAIQTISCVYKKDEPPEYSTLQLNREQANATGLLSPNNVVTAPNRNMMLPNPNKDSYMSDYKKKMNIFLENLIKSINNILNDDDIGITKYKTYLKDVNLIFCIDNSESMKMYLSRDLDNNDRSMIPHSQSSYNLNFNNGSKLSNRSSLREYTRSVTSNNGVINNQLTNQKECLRIFFSMVNVLLKAEIHKITVEFINPVILEDTITTQLQVDLSNQDSVFRLYDCLIQEPYGQKNLVSKVEHLFVKYSESKLHNHIVLLTNGYLDSPSKKFSGYSEDINGLKRLLNDQFGTPEKKHWWDFKLFNRKRLIPTKGSFTMNLIASTKNSQEIHDYLSVLKDGLSSNVKIITYFNDVNPLFNSPNPAKNKKVFKGFVDFIIYTALIGALDWNEYSIYNVENKKAFL